MSAIVTRSRDRAPRTRRKRCSQCGSLKLRAEFYGRVNRTSGISSACRECLTVGQRTRYETRALVPLTAHRKRQIADNALKDNYGLTRVQFDDLVASQDGKCALCRQPERMLKADGEPRQMAVDHDHGCCPGKKSCGSCIRGLLCHRCNMAVGLLGDSVPNFERAVAYLRRDNYNMPWAG